MHKRDKYEERTYNLLLDCGIPAEDIIEPDKIGDNTQMKPDFLIEHIKVAIEVKHFEDKELLRADKKISDQFKKGEFISYIRPVKNNAFEEHLSSASKKFQNYPDYSTLLIEDLGDYSFLKPTNEFLILGIQTLYITKKTGNITKTAQRSRHLRTDKNINVGAVCILHKDSNDMFHNLVAERKRTLPYYFWAQKLEKVEFNQYVYFAPPDGLSHIYKLDSVKI